MKLNSKKLSDDDSEKYEIDQTYVPNDLLMEDFYSHEGSKDESNYRD